MSYEYGNARLRARKSALFDRADYQALLVLDDLDRLLGALHDSAYQPAVEEAVARYRGVRRLDHAVRTHVAGSLRAMARFYDGDAVRWVSLLLRRWDVGNVRTLLRGHAARTPPDELAALLVPVGAIDGPSLDEMARVHSLRHLIDLMVVRRLPDAGVARRLSAAWPRYEEEGNVAVLEAALDRGWALELGELLAELPVELRRVLQGEIDAINLMIAVRLRSLSDAPGGSLGALPDITAYLESGAVPKATLDDVRWASDRALAAASVHGAGVARGWSDAFLRWAEHGRAIRLEQDLRSVLAIEAVSNFWKGDPLGIAIPLAFTWALETEAANLRLIGRGIVHGLAMSQIEPRLVIAL